MENKKTILKRIYVVYFLMCLFGVSILGKVCFILFVQGDALREKAMNATTDYRDIEAVRGNIYAADGSLLATSIPKYEVRFDPNAEAVKKDTFRRYIDTLALSLSGLFPDKSPNQWKSELENARIEGARYHLIRRKVKYTQLQEMKHFPLFRKGRFKGGFMVIQENTRTRPFQLLAARTIGYDRGENQVVGLEGAYKKELRGVGGKRLMQRLSGNVWKPISDENEIEPEDGCDLVTTIDLNIQDVAEQALLEQLERHGADHGCVVLMEVATGKVRAIANLARTVEGNYYESYNYAIGESTEPGSTIKLASYLAAFEDGIIDLEDSVDAGIGEYQFYDKKMYDSKVGGYGKLTIEQAFALSSNIAVARIINENYGRNPQRFVDRLYSMGLNDRLGIEIEGEGKPYIKSANDTTWSGITLPWMSHGYELQLTPLQILTFYNAVANGGRMVKPQFVNEITKDGYLVRKIETTVLNESIASRESIQKARRMLEAVVEYGTATNLRHADYRIAGKTGTAQIANSNYGYYKKDGLTHSYQASFCGYFPAENPKYSCIVVVNAPSNNVYYGNLVAGPIFKEIADKVYSTRVEIQPEMVASTPTHRTAIPVSKNGYRRDLLEVFSFLEVNAVVKSLDFDWVATMTGTDKVELFRREMAEGLVPDVTGMSAMDAVFLLENQGLVVRLQGRGTIKAQSVAPGRQVAWGEEIVLDLS